MAFEDPTLGTLEFFQSLRESCPDFIVSLADIVSGNAIYIYLPIALSAWIFWFRDRRKGEFILVNLFSTLSINGLLKNLIKQPRPWLRDVSLEPYGRSGSYSYSFPSGHASSAASGWGSLALIFRNRTFSVMAVAIIVCVCISRMFLGMHTPLEVLAGVGVAVAIITINARLLSLAYTSYESFSYVFLGYIVAMIPLAVVSLMNMYHVSRSASLGMGLYFGYFIGRLIDHGCFSSEIPNFDNTHTLLYLIIGLIPIGILALVLPEMMDRTAGDVIAGLLSGVWTSLLYPLILSRLSCSER